MYYTNRRRMGRQSHLSGIGSRTGVPIDFRFSYSTLVSGVYSWRTGRSEPSDPPVSPPVRELGNYGLHAPSGRGPLTDQLAERSRYLTEIQRAAFPAETATGSISTNRTSRTDSGHIFVSHKTLRTPYLGYLTRYVSPTDRYEGDVWSSVGKGLINPSGRPLGFLGETTTNLTGSTALNRQGTANRYFESTAPDRKDAGLAVTLLELLRGDVPSLVKNFRKMVSGQKGVANALGSDFLNISFGWTPLLHEAANLMKVGMTLERAVYYESFRRKRSWSGPSASGSLSDTAVLSGGGNVYDADDSLPGEVVPSSASFGDQFTQDGRWTALEDYRFTSKYTGLAKAGLHEAYHSDRAMDVAKRIGLVDDPRLLWDLMPYSWLVDWFTTMGASISNANVYAPLTGKYTSDYAYLTSRYTYTATGHLLRRKSGTIGQYSVRQPTSFVSSSTKWRDRATPFGFGTQLGSLSANQYGILVALGMARTR